MPRKNKTDKKLQRHDPALLQTGVELVIQDNFGIRKAAKRVGVPFQTLARYVKRARDGKETMRYEPNYANRTVLSNEQKRQLADYITEAANLAYGLTYKDCRKLAYQLAVENDCPHPASWDRDEAAGKEWMMSFMKRHPLSLRKPESCSYARNMSFNKPNVDLFFDNLQSVLSCNPKLTDPTRIYNLDETCTNTHLSPEKVIAPTGIRGVQQANSDERGTTVTTCCVISAAGTFLPPVMIFPRQKVNAQMTESGAPGMLALANSSDWMNADAFDSVMDHFIQKTGSLCENPTLLILDNYSSHIDINILQKAKANGVTMLTIAPHTSHKLQPLDVSVFRPFNQYYNEGMRNFMLMNPGTRVTIYQLAEFVAYALRYAMKPSTIQNAFKATGIYPFDQNVFSDEDFCTANVSERKVSPNSQSNDSSAQGNQTTPATCPSVSTAQQSIQLPATSTRTEVNATTSASASRVETSAKSPEDLRPLPKYERAVASVTKAGEPRKKGKTMIATDTPNMNEIKKTKSKSSSRAPKNENKSKGKQPAKKKLMIDFVDESSEEEEMGDKAFQQLLADESGDEYDEEDNEADLLIRIVDVTGELHNRCFSHLNWKTIVL